MNSFDAEDHRRLATRLNGVGGAKWLLTYDNVPQVESLYRERRRQTFSLSYSAHRVVKATEAMVFGDGLVVPWLSQVDGCSD